MGLMPAYFTTTKLDSSKKKSSATSKHELWLRSKGLHVDQLSAQTRKDTRWKQRYSEEMTVDRKDYVSAGMSGTSDSCANRSIMNRLHEEPKHVRDEILFKASRCMPLFNKGALQYATPGEDMTQVGTKSRRG